ncbi:MAG: hypothetical protein EOQ31_35405 [Mesorhizobium sp.]|nr:MAG: hypothetical protein EOQ31_35405 [Mesorhizobium sp.]
MRTAKNQSKQQVTDKCFHYESCVPKTSINKIKSLQSQCQFVTPLLFKSGKGSAILGRRAEKVRILDKFVAVSGFHRKHAMWLLRNGSPAARSDLDPSAVFTMMPFVKR